MYFRNGISDKPSCVDFPLFSYETEINICEQHLLNQNRSYEKLKINFRECILTSVQNLLLPPVI